MRIKFQQLTRSQTIIAFYKSILVLPLLAEIKIHKILKLAHSHDLLHFSSFLIKKDSF
jgi:hypothetical protein